MKAELSKEEARRVVLRCQLLQGHKGAGGPKAAALQIIKHLGYVQIDTIAVVERAHHQVLWSRDARYTPATLDNLQRAGSIFEYWTHAMAYVPMDDYRYYLPRMQNFYNAKHKWFAARAAKSKHLMEGVLQRITAEGPLGAKDFEDSRAGKREGWWDWKPAKDALEFLFWQGRLMVAYRDKFQKVYDIPERVIPAGTNTTPPTEAETALYIARGALRSLGICSKGDIHKYLLPEGSRDSDLRACSVGAVDNAVHELLASGEAAAVSIMGNSGGYIVATDVLRQIPRQQPPALHILSPFDNLVIKRERLRRLFDFDYTIECYLPAAKRKYGYFVLPLLYGTSFAGRIDTTANRKEGVLQVHKLHLENGFLADDGFFALLAEKINAFAGFNGCNGIAFAESNKQTRAVKAALKAGT